MKFKSNIGLEERMMFVDSVIDTATFDGVYEPALYDFAFRICAVMFFTDAENVDAMSEDEMIALAWSEDADKLIYQNGVRKNVLAGLDKACKEKIKYKHEQWMEAYKAVVNPNPMKDLVEVLKSAVDQIGKEIDPKTIMREVLAAQGVSENAVAFPVEDK